MIFARKKPSESAIAAWRNAQVGMGMSCSSRIFASHGVGLDGLPVRINSKTDLRELLRRGGLSKAAAEKVARAGWSALSPEAAVADASERIGAAILKFRAAL